MDKVLSTVDEIVSEWDFCQIVGSHGTSPFVDNDPRMAMDAGGLCSAKAAFARAWYNGLGKPSDL